MRPEDQWVFIMDDDHTFAPELLVQLLDRDVDIVVPLYNQRTPPFAPVAYKQETPDGRFVIYDWPDLEGRDGLLPVASAGKAGVLLRRRVIEALHDPWFEWNKQIGEDHYFFAKARAAGFTVHVDLDARMGHCTPVQITPYRSPEGLWCAEVDLKNGFTVKCWMERVPDAPTPEAALTGVEV